MVKRLGYFRYIELLMLYTLMVVLIPSSYHLFDMSCWRSWTVEIFKNGLGEAYHTTTNYPPVMLYILYLFGKIQGSETKIVENIGNIRIISLLFDFLPVIVLYASKRITNRQRKFAWLLLLNIAYFYNTIIWGQVDGIYTNLVLQSLILAFDFPVVSALIFVIALNTKLQAIVFLPILFLILLPKLKNFRQSVSIFLSVIILQVIILLPFIITGNIHDFWKTVISAVDYYPKVSMNAFNFWHLVCNADVFNLSDNTTWLQITYKQIGLSLFLLFSLVILLPLLKQTIRYFKKSYDSQYMQMVFLVSGLVVIAFFFFNTQMHERYSHPAMILFFFYGVMSMNFSLYAITSIACFLNLEKVLSFLPMAHGTFIYHPKVVASLFLIVLLTGIYFLYRDFMRAAQPAAGVK